MNTLKKFRAERAFIIVGLVACFIIYSSAAIHIGYVVGRDGVVSEAMRYVYDECKK